MYRLAALAVTLLVQVPFDDSPLCAAETDADGTIEVRLGATIPRTWDQVRADKYAYGPKQEYDAATTFFQRQLQLWVAPAKGSAGAGAPPVAIQPDQSTPALPAEDSASRPQAGSFGIASSGESFGDHPRLFPLFHEAGVTMVRSFPEWAGLQPEKGKWNWSHADALVHSARKNRIQIAGVLMYLAPWASSAAPGADHGSRTRTFPIKDMQSWRDYVEGVVTRYRNDVTCWEVYNEFNSPGFARKATVKDYVAMVRDAYEVAKKVDPECQIGIGCADVDDSYASVGDDQIEITVVARRVDAAKAGGCNLCYESAKGYRTTDQWWTIPAAPGWHRHTFRVTDANFANNWGWNFRIDTVSSPDDIWVKEVIVGRVGPRK